MDYKQLKKGSKNYQALSWFGKIIFRFKCKCLKLEEVEREDLEVVINGKIKKFVYYSYCKDCGTHARTRTKEYW